MLSRVADAVFWMARYMERTNNLLRVIRTNYIASQDEVKSFSWKPILQLYGNLPQGGADAMQYNAAKVLENLLLSRENPASVISNVTFARENARSVQDHISKEVWQCLNDFYHLIRDKHLAQTLGHGDPVSVMDVLIKQGMMYYGIVDTTMSRGEDFSFLNTGKYIERGILTTDILHIKLDELGYDEASADAPGWRYLLYSLAGYELYLKTYRGTLQADGVLQQVLYNMQFPHAVLYCLHQANRYAGRLKPFLQADSYQQTEFLIGKIMNEVKYSTVSFGDTAGLQQFLQNTRQGFYQVANHFNQLYFGNS
jgi:uncharacterized alpha-E superfamily protein